MRVRPTTQEGHPCCARSTMPTVAFQIVRGQLMPDSSTRRLFAEFFVIVVGVLVALRVDSAWEIRGEHHREIEYYRSLIQDIAADTAEYVAAIDLAGSSIKLAGYVAAVIRDDVKDSADISLPKAVFLGRRRGLPSPLLAP